MSERNTLKPSTLRSDMVGSKRASMEEERTGRVGVKRHDNHRD